MSTSVQRKQINWGPILAVIVPAAIFVLSEGIVELVVAIYPSLHHWDRARAEAWLHSSVLLEILLTALIQALALGMLWAILRLQKAAFRTLGLIRPRLRDIGYAAAGFAVYFPTLVVLTGAIKRVAPTVPIDQKQNIGFSAAAGPALLLVFVCLVLLPPLVEETLFRGFMYLGLITRLPKLWAALITSVLFAFLHLQIGTGTPLVWSAAIDTFVLSLVLLYLRDKTDSLWPSMILHALKNSLAFMALFVFRVG